MNKYYKPLEWDSDFFGFNVVKINENISNNDELEKCIKIMYDDKVKLAYYFSCSPISPYVLENEFFNISLVHKRVPLMKTLNKSSEIHEKISLYTQDYPEKELIELAQLAGSYSRFGVDENIPKEKYNELFKLWIINSVKKKVASDVLVYRDQGKIVGFATLKVENGLAYTPLFAVSRPYEGKGISFAIMRALETILLERGCKKVLGGTQEVNIKALKVYERYGLVVQKPEYVYHFWRK